jgi:hypothetical protein
MRKRLTALQEKRIKEAKETFGSTVIVKPVEIARLRFPNDFSTNKPRLCKELTERAQIALRDIVHLMQLMSETYTARLLGSSDFESFIFRVMQHASAVDSKQPDATLISTGGDGTDQHPRKLDSQAPYSFRLATVMLNNSLDTIIKSMPQEFQESLKQQIHPFVMLVNAIANFSQSSGARTKTHRLYVPFDISPSFPSNTFKSAM